MGFFHEYPYTDFHEINLDWILRQIMKLHKDYDEFKAANTITNAGAWDITKQYQAWTIVSDNNAGYISLKPVPAGISIDNNEYWGLIADYDIVITDLTARIEALETNQGTLANLHTEKKNTLVDAINEVFDKMHFETVSDMLACAEIVKDTTYLCKGYYASGDDGAGLWTASDTDTGYFHLTAENGLYLYPVCNHGRNVAQYGAYGDMVHDDADAINAAILDTEKQVIDTYVGTPIVFNGKVYRTESTIYIGCHMVQLIGNGSIILGCFNGNILETSERSSSFLHTILIDNLTLQFHDDYKHNYACFVTTEPIYLSRITTLKLYGGRIGWDARKAAGVDTDWGLTVDALYVGDFTVNGLYFAETTAGSPNWNIQTIYVQCASMTGAGPAIQMYNMHTVHIGCIEYNQNVNGGTLLRMDYVYNTVIGAIRVENCLAGQYRYIIANNSQVTLETVFFNPFTAGTANNVVLILGTNGAEVLLNKIRCTDQNAGIEKYIFRLESSSWAALYDGRNIGNMTLYVPGTGTPETVLT